MIGAPHPVVMNAPHLNAYLDSVRKGNRAQVRNSWYVYAFQLPWLPEWQFSRHDFKVVDAMFSGMKHMTPSDIDRYKAAYRQPGAVTAMIGWSGVMS